MKNWENDGMEEIGLVTPTPGTLIKSQHFETETNIGAHRRWYLTHWGWVSHICIGKLTIIRPDNGLLPGLRHAVIWTNDGILFIGPSGTNLVKL